MGAAAGNDRGAAVVVIEPRRGWLSIDWRSLWRHRDLIYFLTWRDVMVRYKQTVLGVLWAVIQPLAKMLVLTAIFAGKKGVDTETAYPYALVTFAALVPWQFFSDALRRSGTSIVASANVIGKVYFPRLAIPMASVGAVLMDLAISFVVLIGIMAYYGVVPGVSLVLILPLVALTVCAALGVGVLLSALSVAYRDFQYVIPFVVDIWFFLTPVMWSMGGRDLGRMRLLAGLNPMAGIVEGYRSALLPGREVDWPLLGVSAATAGVMLVVSLHVFRRLERQFADIV